MRIVALEEHYTVPAIVSRIDPAAIRRRGFPGPDVVWGQTLKRNELAQLGDARIADMDASGITLQVLSVAGPGADVVPGADGIALARDYNNALFEATSRHPDRYQGFAHLPMHSPDAAADELERTVKDLSFRGLLVNGPTDGRFLDDPMFEPILARAEALNVPIYIHPGIPSEKVREAHFDRLPGNFSFALAVSSWGWHMETAIHVLRLVLSGALDRHPRLQIVIGHLGEAIPFMLDRIDETTASEAKRLLRRSVRQNSPRSGLDHDQRVLHDGAVHGRAHDIRRGSHHVLRRLSVRLQCAGAGISRRASRFAGRPKKDSTWQRGSAYEVRDLTGRHLPDAG